MADLKDKYVHQTYHSILSIGTSGTSGLSGTVQNVTDGDGNASALSLSTSRVQVTALTISTMSNYENDSAAAVGGVPVGGLYHTDGVVKIRLT